MKNRHKNAHGQHMGNHDGLVSPSCTIIGVRTSLPSQHPVSASLTHSIFSLAIGPCLKCRPLTASWPMPQMSSSDRILMAAQDTTDALTHPHQDVPFATIVDDTITSLATLLEIFTKKFRKPEANNVPLSPQRLRLTSGNALNCSLSSLLQ
jgi:hypothetical protein